MNFLKIRPRYKRPHILTFHTGLELLEITNKAFLLTHPIKAIYSIDKDIAIFFSIKK